jgi:hypothetical protein
LKAVFLHLKSSSFISKLRTKIMKIVHMKFHSKMRHVRDMSNCLDKLDYKLVIFVMS